MIRKALMNLFFVFPCMVATVASTQAMQDPDQNDDRGYRGQTYFLPERAPTQRLSRWTGFWNSELGLQIKHNRPDLLDVAQVEQFRAQISVVASALGDEVTPELSVQEATFLLEHQRKL